MTMIAGTREMHLTAGQKGGFAQASLVERFVKRAVDLAIVLISLPVLLPVVLVIATVIRLTSSGPAFMSVTRLGQNGTTFRQLRFRCIYLDAPMRAFRATSTGGRDPRLTMIGHALIRSGLNTLPQIFNVLMGQMSLVGPKALTNAPITAISAELMSVRPGMCTPCSLLCAPGESELQRQAVNLAYLRCSTLRSDLKLLLRSALRG